VTGTYLERLSARSAAVGSVMCLGLDPDPANLPRGFSPDVAGIEAFAGLVLETALPFAAAVKPNLSFFEAFGSAGLAALERLRARIPGDVPVVADGKRADIDSTSARQVAAYFDGLGVDAVTVSPYLGEDAIAGYLERPDRFAYVLCRTSNPGAADLEDLPLAAGGPLWERVAAIVDELGAAGVGAAGLADVGAVVGATAPEHVARMRELMPRQVFLLPGIGAQGGRVEDLAPAFAPHRAAGLVTASRSIATAHEKAGGAPAAAARAEAERLRAAAWALA
jgi:orotidine-5'-phosphate decarboxylase